MKIRLIIPFLLVLSWGVDLNSAIGCSICQGFQNALSLREEGNKAAAKAIFVVQATKATLEKNGKGKTDFNVERIVRSPAGWIPPKSLSMEKYIPVESDKENRYLLFCDLEKGITDPYRGILINSPDWEKYALEAVRQNTNDQVSHLLFFMKHLESPNREIANDAFLEFAKANDNALVAIAKYTPGDNLRKWLRDPKVPENRLGLYSFLLGSRGEPGDLALLQSLLESQTPRSQASHDGVLLALVRVHPEKGWQSLKKFLGENNTPLPLRLAAFRVLKTVFDQDQSPIAKSHLRQALASALKQGELSDLVIEELRREKDWGLTQEILSRYGDKGFDTPIVKRAIIRYAFNAPADAKLDEFLRKRKEKEPQLLAEVFESLSPTGM